MALIAYTQHILDMEDLFGTLAILLKKKDDTNRSWIRFEYDLIV